ncbi:MAG: hypothetical protein ACMG6E_04800 [Candidatus Roizmanbacteria bacterium]
MPAHSSDELQSRHLLVGQVSNDLQHLASIAVMAEDFKVEEGRPINAVLHEDTASDKSSDNPLALLGTVK